MAIACNYPITAYRCAVTSQGKHLGYEIVFDDRKGDVVAELRLPCGQCDGCRLERARQWAVRCIHESKMHDRNCFITLTYNDAHLPVYGNLVYDDFQRFMKRLRKSYCHYLPSKKYQGPFMPVRFFMCGEYGENNRRPHFHACLFGIDFDDKVYFKSSGSGAKIFTSEALDKLWRDEGGDSIGFATVGAVTFDSAGYVARYVMKKKLGHGSDKEYEEIDMETGEVFHREKEFNRMSLKPGIGYGFYQKYKSDLFPQDICVINGVATKPPRYYYKKLAKEQPLLYDDIAWDRALKAAEKRDDNTPERLEVKEKVLKAKVKFLKREL